MKAKRVECDKCQNFIEPILENQSNMFGRVIIFAKCKLGKRVMYRKPDMGFSGYPFDTGGYFRYCNDFKPKQ